MFTRPTLLLRKPAASLTGVLLLLSGLLIYAFLAPGPYRPLDRLDLLHLPHVPSLLRPPSLSPPAQGSSSSSSAYYSSWNRPQIPGYCDPGSADDVWAHKYTEENLLLSRAFGASGTRFRRLVQKAMRGEPVKMGVIGGSVSRGRNVLPSETYHARIFRMWNETFFPHPGNTLVDGSKAATGSRYFSMCFGSHIDEDVDLVLVELSINDQRGNRLMENALAWETLVRALLELPNAPAVISTSTFALQFIQGLGVGGDVHLGVANYYDIPVISLRNPILPYLFADPGLEWKMFGYSKGIDRRHMNALGHEMLADFTTHWMRDQVCKVLSERDAPPRVESAEPSWWTAPVDMGEVPRLRMTDVWLKVNETQISLQPSCRSTTTTPRLEPSSASPDWHFEEAPLGKAYWSADVPGAQISFDVTTVEGRVGVFFLRSPKLGLGNARCWVDGKSTVGETAVGFWEKEQSVADYVELAELLEPGKHTVTCEVTTGTRDPGGGHAVKIMGLASV
ncbi:hypothetical protein CALCODRAFT_509987 [Calocera cornea HHB12733]|uniref:Capsular associated protein n=1 Tax=Calocera cornea HHB12733 TaxID=1353952 RepID=A0A165EW03_9BASI|nr:hypothetical protein CALCODRAFT_509987 [Calocera cornea HHB12733]